MVEEEGHINKVIGFFFSLEAELYERMGYYIKAKYYKQQSLII
jgi:hypothetical protein